MSYCINILSIVLQIINLFCEKDDHMVSQQFIIFIYVSVSLLKIYQYFYIHEDFQ